MKSHLKSVGKFCLAGLAIVLFITGCALSTERQVKNQSDSDMSDADVSLKSDRAEIEKLRKSIPEDRRKRNDELKSILHFFGEVRLPPETIQEKYERMFEHERDKFDHEKEKAREKFDRQEQKERDAFEKKLKDERREYLKGHHSSNEREQFFSDQEDKREAFNNDELEKRDEFDSAWREKTDDFNSDMNDKRQEFMEQFRDYTVRYKAWKKSLRDKNEQNEQ